VNVSNEKMKEKYRRGGKETKKAEEISPVRQVSALRKKRGKGEAEKKDGEEVLSSLSDADSISSDSYSVSASYRFSFSFLSLYFCLCFPYISLLLKHCFLF